MPRAAAPRVGDTLRHYRLDAVVSGRDDDGPIVFAATDVRLGRRVAITSFPARRTTDGWEHAAAVRRALDVSARLDSPHVAQVYDHGLDRGWSWLATRQPPGDDLQRVLDDGRPIGAVAAAQVVAQVAEALSEAHAAGVVHGDLEARRVSLGADGLQRPHVYLTGFGAHDGPDRDADDDVRAVGRLLGRLLDAGGPPRTSTGRLSGVAARASGEDASARYGSMAELRDDLRGVLATEGAATVPTGAPATVAPSARARRRGVGAVVAASGVLALLLVAGFLVALVRDDDARNDTGAAAGNDAVVRGDLDGDGFGDVGVEGTAYSDVGLLYSDGRELSEIAATRRIETPAAVADIDGDGVNEIVEAAGQPPSLTAEIHSAADGRDGVDRISSSAPLPLPEAGNRLIFDIAALDVDGDGDDDLAVFRRARLDFTITGFVSRGDGTFEPGEQWATGTAATKIGTLVSGDFDGDGDGDLATVEDDGGIRTTLFPAEDGALGEPTVATATDEAVPVSVDHATAGDLDGDGTDEVVVSTLAGAIVSVAPSREPEQITAWSLDGALAASDEGALSDVDGDGRDDWVTAEPAPGGQFTIVALVSDGSQLEQEPAFDRLIDSSAGTPALLDRSARP